MSMKLHEFTAIAILIMIVAWIGFTTMTPGLYANSRGATLAAGTNNPAAQAATGSGSQAGAGTNAVAGAQAGAGSQAGAGATGGAGASGGEVTIPLKVVNGYYEPRTITVKQGDKVKLDLDASTFRGCMSIFNIWGIKESFVVSASNHIVEFTADKAGTYRMSCPMGMGNGQLIVQTSDGQTVAAPTGTPAGPSGGSCGGSSGGCGCGG